MIDIGANLTRFEDHELEAVLTRADNAGLDSMIITGTSIDSIYAAKRLADTHVELYFTAGCHPHYAKRWQSIDTETMDMFLRNPKCLCVGETGLDYCRMLSTKDEQEYAFKAQIELSIQYKMPLFLHERQAHASFLRILDSYGDKLPTCIVHCFTGNKTELSEYIARDFYIGITGWLCDDKRGQDLQEAVNLIPDNRLLVETDSPFLAPKGDWLKYVPYELQEYMGRTQNEPSAILAVIHACAQYRAQTFDHVRYITTQNALHIISTKKEITFKFEDVYNWD